MSARRNYRPGPRRPGCLALGTSTLTYTHAGESLWADITWPAALTAALRALAGVAPNAALPLTAMCDGIDPQRLARIIEARAEFTGSPLTASDISTLAEHASTAPGDPRSGLAGRVFRGPARSHGHRQAPDGGPP